MLLEAKALSKSYVYGLHTIVTLVDDRDCPSNKSYPNGNGYCLAEGEGVEMCAFLGKGSKPHRCEHYKGIIGSFGSIDRLDVKVSCFCKDNR